MVPRFASTKAESPEWNRKNKVTRVLAKIDKPKDYALQWYSTLKGHYDEMTGMTKIEAAQQAVYDIEVGFLTFNGQKQNSLPNSDFLELPESGHQSQRTDQPGTDETP